MTYDNAGNAYYGPIAKIDGTKLTITSGFDPKSHSYTNRVEGGAMVVVAGAGAGQYKRIVSWPGSINGTSGVFEIDSPLAAPLDATSVVEVMPMRCVAGGSVCTAMSALLSPRCCAGARIFSIKRTTKIQVHSNFTAWASTI